MSDHIDYSERKLQSHNWILGDYFLNAFIASISKFNIIKIGIRSGF